MDSDHDTDELESEEEETSGARHLPIPSLGSKQPSLRKLPTSLISQGMSSWYLLGCYIACLCQL